MTYHVSPALRACAVELRVAAMVVNHRPLPNLSSEAISLPWPQFTLIHRTLQFNNLSLLDDQNNLEFDL